MPPSSGNRQWKLTFAYDGTDFHGWQVQPGCPTVQGILADAIARVTGERVLPQGSGRTDAGVHACGQVASFSLAAPIPAVNLHSALNRLLPAAIRILAAEQVPADFHARHSALRKVYRYRIFRGEICPPFLARYVANCRWPLELDRMQQAASAILGEHDFTSFAATDPDRAARLTGLQLTGLWTDSGEQATGKGSNPSHGPNADLDLSARSSNVRSIYRSEWSRVPLESVDGLLPTVAGSADQASEREGPSVSGHAGRAAEDRPGLLVYTICGNGFLHHMVRNLVGTFLDVGRGHLPASCMPEILQARNRALAGPTAPAQGLCLENVDYTEADR